jgi:putative glutathione S-transferase
VFRALKGLEAILPVSVVSPKMPDETGWTFRDDGSTGDALFGSDHLYEVYQRANPGYTGRVTVPVLWDKQRQTIVNNESSEIIRMLNSAFNGLTGNEDDYYPEVLRPRIDEINKRVYNTVNNGVYKAGFATRQAAYEENVRALFESLDWIEDILSDNAYLTGGQVTEADWRLFTTLVRFDAVYYGHFKCNIRQIADYPNISHYLKGLVATPGVRETIHIDHIKTHYYWSHTRINPTQIVPVGPELAFLD